MAKTTNILDLNNRLTKVEKGNVAQNNYNSLKNRPKINGNLLTGDKTGAQLGLADAQIVDAIGNITDLGNVQGSGTITLSHDITKYRFILVLAGYYQSGFPCFGEMLLPTKVLPISVDDIPISLHFSDSTESNTGHIDVSFLSSTSVKVVNTSTTVYTRFMGVS